MKNINQSNKFEQGQIIVIVAISLFALIALAALILDGGALLLNRRVAQNAADAGALAGARVFCYDETITLANAEGNTLIDDAVELYTVTENQADSYVWKATGENLGVIDELAKGEIEVTVQVRTDSFFARIFGEDILSASATAAAGCFNSGPSVVLPIAFPCQQNRKTTSVHGTYDDNSYPFENAPIGGEIVLPPEGDCDYAMLDWQYFDWVAKNFGATNPLIDGVPLVGTQGYDISEYLANPDQGNKQGLLYIVVNELKFCAKDPENVDPTNEVVCDLMGDGASQLNTSSRGWLNLSDGDAGHLTDWIEGSLNPKVSVHSWLSFLGGVRAQPTFTALKSREYDIVYIPVFNYICDDNPNDVENDACRTIAHNGGTTEDGEVIIGVDLAENQVCEVVEGNPGNDFAHIVAFAPFFPTCVRVNSSDIKELKSVDDLDGWTSECPGFELAIKLKDDEGNYLNYESLKDTDYSFEGYFIDPSYLDDPENMNFGAADIGIYTALLTR